MAESGVGTEACEVVIVGGGYSGAMLALHIARRARSPLSIVIVEPRAELGAGLAYSTGSDVHKINVGAAIMGVSQEPGDNFLSWIEERHPALLERPEEVPGSRTYVPRRWFADFVRDRLAESVGRSPVTLTHRRAAATEVEDRGSHLLVSLSDGGRLAARRLVVTASYDVPSTPPGLPGEILDAPGYVGDPWDLDRLLRIPAEQDVLIVGTGLTMADVTATLLERGHRGRIIGLSRHGLLPRPNAPSATPHGFDVGAWPVSTARQALRRVREEIRLVEAAGGSWLDVFTALREQTERLWSKLPHSERRRFLRHLRSFYDVHRYRMAPDIAMRLQTAQEAGQLAILAGRLTGGQRTADGRISVEVQRRSAPNVETVLVSSLVNCMGPKQRLAPQRNHFLGALIAAGLAEPDALGLGLSVDERYRLSDRSDRLFAFGPLTRARFGDTIGAPEILRHAQILAEQLCRCGQSGEEKRFVA
jgi:uncharacterized NAD(P)/FAD-binding protein YdhS